MRLILRGPQAIPLERRPVLTLSLNASLSPDSLPRSWLGTRGRREPLPVGFLCALCVRFGEMVVLSLTCPTCQDLMGKAQPLDEVRKEAPFG